MTTPTIEPLRPLPEVRRFLAGRRSRPAKTLRAPAPDRAALERILEVALRVPDHGKLEPWRLVVLGGAALQRLGALAEARAAEIAPDKAPKLAAQFRDAPLVVAVVAAPEPSEAIPEIEQTLSAGALCLALLNAAHAEGWGANWLTGAVAYDEAFLRGGLGLEPSQWVAGFVVIGTEGAVPPERPRPDLARIIRWVDR
ncbi:nitroreductase family protein [Jannaschia sp. W003]|uniref:nitroreductase family protein n=1 Tax=Jannaschia sp. W003 TaxID=2867012 RepID=UPI0021A4BF93|nr:nitroreductase family protein [Jannaschia sp. W003]UWQ22654.1 nitroreductase family protein [Jannaschia sp. W003]